MKLWICAAVGLVVTGAIVVITEYYTATKYAPVKHIAGLRRPVPPPTSSPALRSA